MDMLQRALRFFQRDVRVLMDQFYQEIVEGRQAATPGLAAVRDGVGPTSCRSFRESREVDAADISTEALSLAEENRARLLADNLRLLHSDLFTGLQGEHYDLIVTNPPYVTNDETDALPKEYSFEPELGLRAGDDGLDLALRILRDAPLHLTEDGLLVCEVGESERALHKLLPELPPQWRQAYQRALAYRSSREGRDAD